MRKPLILITNDDGVNAAGISALTNAMARIGDVVVVAPDRPRSGKSSAITPDKPIRLSLRKEYENVKIYACSGTPTDCVKMSINQILDRRPDLLVSGINHGPNTAISVIYSGTMGAALEGCINDIPSIGFSLCHYECDSDFEEAATFAESMARKVLENGLPKGVCFNVNIPGRLPKGVRFCHQTDGKWVEEFIKRTDPAEHDYYWLSGHYENNEPENEHSDEWAVANNYIAVVPCKIDFTDYDFLNNYKKMNYDF